MFPAVHLVCFFFARQLLFSALNMLSVFTLPVHLSLVVLVLVLVPVDLCGDLCLSFRTHIVVPVHVSAVSSLSPVVQGVSTGKEEHMEP